MFSKNFFRFSADMCYISYNTVTPIINVYKKVLKICYKMYIICQMYDWNKYIDIIRITYFREIFSFPLAISIPDKIRNRVKSQTRIPATGSAAPCRSNFLFPLYIQGICSFDLFLINQKPLPSHKPWPSQSEPAPSKKCKAKNYFKKRTLFYISLCLSVQRQVSSV